MNEAEQRIEQRSNNPGYMKKYLKLALDIETNVLLWEDALRTNQAHLEHMNGEIKQLQDERRNGDIFKGTKESIRTSMQEQIAAREEKRKRCKKKEKRRFWIKAIICAIVFVVLAMFFHFSGAGMEIGAGMFGSDTPYFLASIIVSAMFSGLFALILGVFLFLIPSSMEKDSDIYLKQIKSLKKKLEEFDQEEKEVISNNRYIDSTLPQIIKKQSYLENRINQISYHLDESKAVRSMIYREGVLPEKYQNIVSVASLYQFLVNGICTQIKGHGGIYDTYEYHLKLNDIISNLVEIRKDLRRIKENQEFLYDKLCDVHETLTNINAGINSAAKEISSNTAMAAEAAKRTAIAQEWRNREIWYR